MNKIYLDNNSTTQVDPNVLKKMLPYFGEKFGNASSQSHAFGWEAQAANDIAREQVAKLINAKNLVITHYSSRIKNTEELTLEASDEFEMVHAASDSDIINLTATGMEVISQL